MLVSTMTSWSVHFFFLPLKAAQHKVRQSHAVEELEGGSFVPPGLNQTNFFRFLI